MSVPTLIFVFWLGLSRLTFFTLIEFPKSRGFTSELHDVLVCTFSTIFLLSWTFDNVVFPVNSLTTFHKVTFCSTYQNVSMIIKFHYVFSRFFSVICLCFYYRDFQSVFIKKYYRKWFFFYNLLFVSPLYSISFSILFRDHIQQTHELLNVRKINKYIIWK